MTMTVKTLCRAITWSAAWTALLLLAACGTAPTPNLAGTPILDVANPQDLAAFPSLAQGERLGEPVIIKVPRGFSLPVRMVVDTPLASMESHCSQMVFKEDLFLALSNEAMLVSPDLKHWANAAEMEAVKELFGGDKGELAVSMGADKQQGAQIDLKLIVHPKAR